MKIDIINEMDENIIQNIIIKYIGLETRILYLSNSENIFILQLFIKFHNYFI